MRPDNHLDSLRDPRRDQLLRPAGRQRVQVGAQGHRRAGQAADKARHDAGRGRSLGLVAEAVQQTLDERRGVVLVERELRVLVDVAAPADQLGLELGQPAQDGGGIEAGAGPGVAALTGRS